MQEFCLKNTSKFIRNITLLTHVLQLFEVWVNKWPQVNASDCKVALWEKAKYPWQLLHRKVTLKRSYLFIWCFKKCHQGNTCCSFFLSFLNFAMTLTSQKALTYWYYRNINYTNVIFKINNKIEVWSCYKLKEEIKNTSNKALKNVAVNE